MHSFADCFIQFGDYTVSVDTSEAIYFAAGTEVLGIPEDATHIAVKTTGEAGVVNVTGLASDYHNKLTTNTLLVVSSSSSNVALPSGAFVRLFAMTDTFINFGDNTVTARDTDTFFEAGTEILDVPTDATHIAAIRYTLDGGLYVTGVE